MNCAAVAGATVGVMAARRLSSRELAVAMAQLRLLVALAALPLASSFRAAPLPRRLRPRAGPLSLNEFGGAVSDEDKELTGSTIKFSELSDEMGALVMTALAQRDRERLLSGQEKYETLDGMISAYEELGKEKGWTRADAESEVVRYLQRRAIAAEGSLDGDGQDNATFGLLAFAIALALYGAATGSGLLPDFLTAFTTGDAGS